MKQIIPGLLAIIIPVIAFSCNSSSLKSEAPEPFCLTDTLKKKIILEEVKEEIVQNSISLSGKIEANEDKWIKIFPVVSGVVQEMKVQLGDFVKKGQVLAVIRSSEIAEFQNQLSVARSNIGVTEKALQASKDMFKAGLATERDVAAAENELTKAKSELKRNEQTNSIYGSSGNALQTITAPISGYIIEKNVTDKMQYRADGSQPFFVISNLDEVWVMASVFENDISKIKEGFDADIRVIAYKDKVFNGKVDRIFTMLDPQSRVMKIRVRIQNTDKLLKPEMFAQMEIRYNSDNNRMSSIPSNSIIFDNNKNFVMVYRDQCNMETREVEIYQTLGNTTYIKSGLQPGEKIISQYQLLVYDALND